VTQRTIFLGIILLLAFGSARAQSDSNTVRIPADTMFVIPAGPAAGSFTDAARLTVLDTVAGWARIQVEGWVPVHTVLGRMNGAASVPLDGKNKSAVKANDASQQCEAMTKKGTRCKRKAMPDSKFCWQHRQ
jgi:hypothetical protein